MHQKKAQSSIEFIVLIGFVLFFFVIFMLIIEENMSLKRYQSQSSKIKELAVDVQDELNLALGASDGYQRNFFIPDQVAGLDYQINITEEMVYIRTDNGKHAIALPVANATGDVRKGMNQIKKENGEIKLNVGS
jgi:hypothetical protein